MAILECREEKEKLSEMVNFKMTEKELRDLSETALALGLDKSEYIRAAIFISKPFLLKMKSNFSFYLSLLSRMHGD